MPAGNLGCSGPYSVLKHPLLLVRDGMTDNEVHHSPEPDRQQSQEQHQLHVTKSNRIGPILTL